MARGRITEVEKNRRLKLLLNFVFIFRYATRGQLETFAKTTLKIPYPQWTIERHVDEGYLNGYYEYQVSKKIYHLTKKGKDFISQDEPFIADYHFEKTHAGINTFHHQKAVVDAYFWLSRYLEMTEWVSEWVLRADKRGRKKIPDGIMMISGGLRIALEVETRYKRPLVLRGVIYRYRYDIEKISQYDAVLFIVVRESYLRGFMARLSRIAPEFCASVFIFSSLKMLEREECFYQSQLRSIKEAVSLLKTERKKNGEEL